MKNEAAPIATGSSCLTDNWLLQNAAELLQRSIDPGTEAEWLEIAADGEFQHRSIAAGAIHTMCLLSLIEQIVFCDSMMVMEEWTSAWAGESSQIDLLLNNDIVVGFHPPPDGIDDRIIQYRKFLCKSDGLTQAANDAALRFKSGESDFVGQVLNGTAPYLAQADITGYSYSPHPVRARLLEQTLYKISTSFDVRQKVEDMVNTTRLKLVNRIGADSVVTSLSTRMPSIALLCLSESSQQSPPIETAIQLRNSPEFRRLRSAIHEMQMALGENYKNGAEFYADHIEALNAALREIERRMRLREFDKGDGVSEIDVWRGIKARVPGWLRRPAITPRHTTAVYRLVDTTRHDVRRLLDQSLGLTDPRIIEDLMMFYNLGSSRTD